MNRLSTISIILNLFITVLLSSCDQLQTSNSSALFPKDCDSSNMYDLVNFTDKGVIKSIINEDIFLANGEKRKKGFLAIPQDYDDFRGINLDEVYWKGIHVIGGDFRGVKFRSAKCMGSVFKESDFRICDIRWSYFMKSNLSHCKLSRAILFRMYVNDADISHSDLRGANMFGVRAHRTNFRDCDFTNALMKESEFLYADFTGSKAVNVRFTISVFTGAKMDSTDLCYADFTGAGLEDVSFVDARIKNAQFRGAHLQGADFTGANLKGSNFFAAEFVNTIFKDAKNIPEGLKDMIVDDKITGVCHVNSNSL